jgi:hypothetical protein
VLVILMVIIFAVLNAAGIIFSTEVERRTFERSYQKKAGDKQRSAILRAQLAEIESQLLDPKLDPNTKRQLKAQAAAIRVRLRADAANQQR